jgi:hypothetical protein
LGDANRGFPSVGRPTDPDSDTEPNTDPNGDTDPNANANLDPDSNADLDPDSNANLDPNAKPDPNSNSNANANPDFPEVCSRVLRHSTDGADDGGSDIPRGAGGWEPERGDCRMERYNRTG